MQGRVSIRTGFGWLVGLSSVSPVCMRGAGGSGALGVAGWERATRRCAFKSLSLSYIITRVAPHCVNTLRILHAAYDATKVSLSLILLLGWGVSLSYIT